MKKIICLLLRQDQTLWVKKGGKFFLVIVHFKKFKFYSKLLFLKDHHLWAKNTCIIRWYLKIHLKKIIIILYKYNLKISIIQNKYDVKIIIDLYHKTSGNVSIPYGNVLILEFHRFLTHFRCWLLVAIGDPNLLF